MAQLVIREATTADIPVLLRHRRLMWWDMGQRDELALDQMERAATEYFSQAVPQGSYRGFVAIDSTGMVIGGGGIVISPWPGLLGQLQPTRAMILNLYVEREHRRQGIANALMKKMIAWCRENRFCSVALHTSEEGRALYQRLGFKPTNEMRLDFDSSAAPALELSPRGHNAQNLLQG
jgi:ribosomal protein S18 acetylase RimI-like enzyme